MGSNMEKAMVPMGASYGATNVAGHKGSRVKEKGLMDWWAWNIIPDKKYVVKEVYESLIMEQRVEGAECLSTYLEATNSFKGKRIYLEVVTW